MSGARLAPPPDPAWAYFLDIDGTLAALARTPAQTKVDDVTRSVVEHLWHATGGAVALVTGRSLADVDRLFPGAPCAVAGQHGAETRVMPGRVTRATGPRALHAARSRLADAAAHDQRLLLEDKGLSIALHYRRAPALASYAHRVARAAAEPLGPRWCVQVGKRVVEIRLAGRDKGTAIERLMREPRFRRRIPVFIGDDTADELGFRVVNRMGGFAVKVGPGATGAGWRLPNVAAVRGWLSRGEPRPRAIRRAPPHVNRRRAS